MFLLNYENIFANKCTDFNIEIGIFNIIALHKTLAGEETEKHSKGYYIFGRFIRAIVFL